MKEWREYKGPKVQKFVIKPKVLGPKQARYKSAFEYAEEISKKLKPETVLQAKEIQDAVDRAWLKAGFYPLGDEPPDIPITVEVDMRHWKYPQGYANPRKWEVFAGIDEPPNLAELANDMSGETLSSLYVKFHTWATNKSKSLPNGAPVLTQILDGMAAVGKEVKKNPSAKGEEAVRVILKAMDGHFTSSAQPIPYLMKKYGQRAIDNLTEESGVGGMAGFNGPLGDVPTPKTKKDTQTTLKELAEDASLFDKIGPGSRVTIVNRFGQKHSGRAVMFNSQYGSWVLNMGGAHGTPAIATPENVVAVSGGRSGKRGIGESSLREFIPKSDEFGLAKDGVLIAKGSKRLMLQQLKKAKNDTPQSKFAIWRTYQPVGSKMSESYHGDIGSAADNVWRDWFHKNNGKMTVGQVESAMKKYPAFKKSFAGLVGDYIFKKGNEYVWPEMIGEGLGFGMGTNQIEKGMREKEKTDSMDIHGVIKEAGLDSPLNGREKRSAANWIYKNVVANTLSGIFKDDSWQPVHAFFKKLEQQNITVSMEGADYQHNAQGQPSSKQWKFTIPFVNKRGTEDKLHGTITAHGAGSVKDPLDRYDVTAIIG